MTNLNALREATTLSEFAHVIGYAPKSLSFILYKFSEDKKYTTFQIKKRTGGMREIQAPAEPLKLLQKTLSKFLYKCLEEIEEEKVRVNSSATLNKNKREFSRPAIAHGFKKGLTISTNADMHKHKRFVLNLDLANFFPSINFGRVRGFFITDNKFKLNPAVATVIAQIACYNNQLPQGSPCSPVISNLVGQILDYRLVKLAKKHGCTYTRYADDLTFSTNLKKFPEALAYNSDLEGNELVLGRELMSCINRAGFNINESKTRIQFQTSRQMVTGLVVNRLVNTKAEYYRYARSMCHSLFVTGKIYCPPSFFKDNSNPTNDENVSKNNTSEIKNSPDPRKEMGMDQLEGMLNFIFSIKNFRNRYADKENARPKANKAFRDSQYSDTSHMASIAGIKKIYGRFLFFKYFYALDKPLLYCEGKTDNVYIRCALRQLYKQYPQLIQAEDDNLKLKIKLFSHSNLFHSIVEVSQGSGGIVSIFRIYKSLFRHYKCPGKRFPVIMLIDNDDGAKDIYKIIEGFDPVEIPLGEATIGKKAYSYYYVKDNFYVLPTPGENSKIEDCFDQATLNTKLGKKSFNPNNENLENSQDYGKAYFAEYVVSPKQDKINFKNFKPILDGINAIIDDYDKRSH